MAFHPFEVTIPHIIYAALGAFVVLFGMFSLFLRERLYIGEACWAFLFGVIIGPECANIFDPRAWGNHNAEVGNVITLEFTRVVLAIGVFAIGVELPKAYMKKHWRSIAMLLGPVMTWGWFVSAGLIFALVPGLNFLSSLAVAACLTPTDPILAAAVVGGRWADKHVPAHLRHLLAAESGCNDGAAFPFLYIALYLILDKNTGSAVKDWFLLLWLYQVVVGTLIGGVIGFSFRHLMKFCTKRDLIDRHSYVAQYVSLALLTIGVCTLLGSDDLLACFVCGTAFAWDGFFNRQTEESVFSSVIDLLFNVAAFVYVGAWTPFSKFQDAELTLSVWRLIVIAILILLLRRLPVIIALYRWIPDIKTFREAVFSGHFGPIGVGAVFISTLANQVIVEGNKGDNQQTQLLADTIQPIVSFMVLCSIITHGLSIPGLSLGRRVHSVSRTWSRHTGGAEWANQTRHIERGDDIVINRDDAMERGGDRVASLPTEGELDGSDHTKVERVRSNHSADYREPSPPDGDALISEWIEPHHIITETRSEPGSDVDVVVTNNESNEPQETWSEAVRKLENKVVSALSPGSTSSSKHSIFPVIKEHVGSPGGSTAPTTSGTLVSAGAPTEPRKKRALKEFGVHGRRIPTRRTSAASSSLQAQPLQPSEGLSTDIPEEHIRGSDTTEIKTGTSPSPSIRRGSLVLNHDALTHRRIRALSRRQSRDSSPDLSVHFADSDDQRSSSAGKSVLSPGHSVSESPVELEPESAKSRVTFELPRGGDGSPGVGSGGAGGSA